MYGDYQQYINSILGLTSLSGSIMKQKTYDLLRQDENWRQFSFSSLSSHWDFRDREVMTDHENDGLNYFTSLPRTVLYVVLLFHNFINHND